MTALFVLIISFIPLIAYWIGNNKNKQGKTALGYYKAGRIIGYIVLAYLLLEAVFQLLFFLNSEEGILPFLFYAIFAIPCYKGTKKCEDERKKELSRSEVTIDNSNTNFEQSTKEKSIDSQISDESFIRAGQDRVCPNCGADIPEGADHCEYCETKF